MTPEMAGMSLNNRRAILWSTTSAYANFGVEGEETTAEEREGIFRESLELCKELTAWEHWGLKSSTLIFRSPMPAPPS